MQESAQIQDSLDVAIIGMAGRFPGAKSVEEFWRNLRDGVEAIARFTDEQLLALGVAAGALRDPNFVKAGALLEGGDLFDAGFFGYSPREAELLDPQHRVLLECAWEALENAGYLPEAFPGMIGVYAGTSLSTYLLFNLMAGPLDAEDTFQVMIGNDKDFLSTRVAYELNLKGPTLDIQTACSTSLVAVHLACQGLLSYQCDMALVGGVSVQVPQRTGYYYQEGGINSPDGHCRAFDAKAAGTVFGSGVGMVVLKRLTDALVDGDTIYATLKGSAINNDGSSKIGYTAPSIDGQAQVVALAHLVAGVAPETISYVETHGTGTALGDPVEVAGLTKAFRTSTQASGFCALGSVKTNVGHLDAAAGITSLIKTVLALKHRQLPPSLHFEQPNPRIDFASSPFYVNSRLAEWPAGATPRRAGVSSFGIGGTNAHVIVEEAPPSLPSGESRAWQLLTLSAKTDAALEAATADLCTYLKQNPEVNLADVAYTLQVGRKVFNHRRVIACHSATSAIAAIESRDPQRLFTTYQEPGARPLVFMFPGGGAQYVDMGRDLYAQEPVFTAAIDKCAELLTRLLGYDLRDCLYPVEAEVEECARRMKQTSLGLPALFSVEYALARLWMHWGLRPQAMIGHSLGEYVAACLAGVFRLEDALALVHLRAKLFDHLPKGAMLSVPLNEQEARAMMNGGLSLAAINGPAQCVVSGPIAAIEQMAEALAARDVEYRKLQIDVAAHSQMVAPIVGEFTRSVERMRLNRPAIPLISNVTGNWADEAQLIDPAYWGRHLRQTVRFADGVLELFKEPSRILLEVGPGQTLATLTRSLSEGTPGRPVFASMRHPYDKQSDDVLMLTALGKLWLAGADIDWGRYYDGQQRRRLPLPTYPFQRQRYWVEPAQPGWRPAAPRAGQGKRPDIGQWFYTPSWKKTPALTTCRQEQASGPADGAAGVWLVLEDEGAIGAQLSHRLREAGEEVIRVEAGQTYERIATGHYRVEVGRPRDYEQVLQEVLAAGKPVRRVVHLWSLQRQAGPTGKAAFEGWQYAGFYSLIFLIQALGNQGVVDPVQITVVANHLHAIESQDEVLPEKATLLGPGKVAPQEFDNLSFRVLDVALPAPGTLHEQQLLDHLIAECHALAGDEVVAYRGPHRWVQIYEPLRFDGRARPVRAVPETGVYLLVGGLGGIGLLLAEFFARGARAKLILTQRSAFPGRDEWEGWLSAHEPGEETSRKIRRLMGIEAMGAEVLIARADVADEGQMREVVSEIAARYGKLDGVIHLAGVAGEQSIKLIPQLEPADGDWQFRPKALGLYALENALRECPPEVCVLFSSNAAILGGLGSATYAAANLFMDAFAASRSKPGEWQWLSTNWDGWLTGEDSRLTAAYQTSLDQYAMTPDESADAFGRLFASVASGQVVVSTGDLADRLDLYIKRRGQSDPAAGHADNAPRLHPRPVLGTPYVAPQNQLEQKIVHIWQELLGVERLGIHDNFFDLGGNSLICLKVVSRLKKELGVELPVVAVFEGPTVSALAGLIARAPGEQSSYDESHLRGQRRRERRKALKAD